MDALTPDPAALTALSRGLATNGFFVSTRATGEEHVLTWSRMFAPVIGIFEDPVTGNGYGHLGAYLLRHGIVPAPSDRLSFTGRQGAAPGRPGDVRVHVETGTDGEILVSTTGTAVTAYQTELPV
ncbi:PhzF family phenazine biosynthesis protein [Streptomyces viridiviolaceus]